MRLGSSLASLPPLPRVVLETRRVFTRVDYAVFSALTALAAVAVVYFAWRWFEEGTLSVSFVALTALVFPALALAGLRWLSLPLMVRPCQAAPSPALKVAVATTFVPSAEPLPMLRQTLRALVAMRYEHDTWVLDEEGDPKVRALCAELGARYFTRRDLAQYHEPAGRFASRSKHGNYNAWLYETGFDEYEVLVAFDPDHIPHPDFLLSVLGFLRDPDVGYVQAAQTYYNEDASFIARGAAEETYAFYSFVSMSAAAGGYPPLIGCHNTHRMTALREVGGFAPHDADDVLLSVLYHVHGWRGVYVPERLAVGLTPVDWPAYLDQQRRWARSVLDLKLRVIRDLSEKLGRRSRIMFFFYGLSHVRGVVAAVLLVLLAYMLVTGETPLDLGATWPAMLSFAGALVACNAYRQRFYVDARKEWGFHWRAALLRVGKWPSLFAAAWDALGRRSRPYLLTPKKRREGRRRFTTAPHALTIVVVALAWLVGIFRGVLAADVLHVTAASVIAVSLAIVVSEWRRFPPPFDEALAERAARDLAARGSVPSVASQSTAEDEAPSEPRDGTSSDPRASLSAS